MKITTSTPTQDIIDLMGGTATEPQASALRVLLVGQDTDDMDEPAWLDALDTSRTTVRGTRPYRPIVYVLSSVKSPCYGRVAGYGAACRMARTIQAQDQAAYGVDVSRPDGLTVYTAR